jgi:hypothetical protein
MTAPPITAPFSTSVMFTGTQQPPLGPNTVKVTQCEFAHDVATMQFWADDVDSSGYISGSPMLLTFGNSTDGQRIFYGYVNHAGRVNNALSTTKTLTDRNSTIVTCVGASWPMKQPDTKCYSNMTSSQIIESIAQQFGLASLVVPTSTVWATKQMAGLSYWQFAVALAQLEGYTFYCSGVQLTFRPRQTNPNNLTGLVAVYDYRYNPSGMPIFTPEIGSNSPSGGQLRNRQLASIDPYTGQIIYATAQGTTTATTLGVTPDTAPFNLVQHDTVQSQAEANTKVTGAGMLNQLYITANAVSAGNPTISQGSLIFVQNANGSQNGLWFVTEASQQLNAQNYSTHLCLGRDSRGTTTSISGGPQFSSPPTAGLKNGFWVAV